MAPVQALDAVKEVQQYINTHRILVFSKSTCPFCDKVKELFTSLSVDFYAYDLDLNDNGPELHEELKVITGQRTVPYVFINGHLIGGCDKTMKLHSEGVLGPMISPETPIITDSFEEQYDFDLIVVGGGSGGLAASKEAANLGKKVAVFDFVVPTPIGTTWGLGGTCVNVGCIPKKLMHQASLLGEAIKDAKKFGWVINNDVEHNWTTMKNAIQSHVASLNWGYRVQLRDKQVQYFNSFAEFISPHKIRHVNNKGKEGFATARHFVLATGMRPRYPDIPGDKDYCITSDDLFSLSYCPGKTLVVGASYVALECGGFLKGIGLDVTIVVRSILLRGFDQDMAKRIGTYMENLGIKFIYETIPTKIEQIEEGKPGLLRVTSVTNSGEEIVDEYNTVLLAIGRDACTLNIGLDKTCVQHNLKNGKIPTFNEQTNVSHIYAIGDVLENRPELTPVAIQAGKLLARRLFADSEIQCDYVNVPTTVFTPIEYGCVGYAEEVAIEKFGQENIEIYHSFYWPLEFTVPKRMENDCYAKVICLKYRENQVIGFHVLGPNAGEITQGFAVAIKLGATMEDFHNTIGIHPTCAEIFTTMETTKGDGELQAAGGC